MRIFILSQNPESNGDNNGTCPKQCRHRKEQVTDEGKTIFRAQKGIGNFQGNDGERNSNY